MPRRRLEGRQRPINAVRAAAAEQPPTPPPSPPPQFPPPLPDLAAHRPACSPPSPRSALKGLPGAPSGPCGASDRLWRAGRRSGALPSGERREGQQPPDPWRSLGSREGRL
ncbi:hypothetical protein P7K49_000654 [Saguinus oedipus]|uniref:Uncharacterized protein n=1 Tax=Saguinus oedipus TaxID=9490 RepID=A0ABQ9WCB7_SAGOE|nr:hypothetical protein P7K49_000654 [Saguinus oedipus]